MLFPRRVKGEVFSGIFYQGESYISENLRMSLKQLFEIWQVVSKIPPATYLAFIWHLILQKLNPSYVLSENSGNRPQELSFANISF